MKYNCQYDNVCYLKLPNWLYAFSFYYFVRQVCHFSVRQQVLIEKKAFLNKYISANK